MNIPLFKLSGTLVLIIVILHSCSKDSPVKEEKTCASKTITLTAQLVQTSGIAASDGAIAATASGSNNFTYSLNNGNFQANGQFNNLSAGNYLITAKDAQGCTGQANFVVTSVDCPVITFNASTTSTSGPIASDGKITVNAVNGGTPPYQYSIDGGLTYPGSGDTYVFTNLAVGNNYSITIKDAKACLAVSPSNLSVNSQCALDISLQASSADACSNTLGSVTATSSGGSGNYQYSTDGQQYMANNTFNNLPVGTYTIYVKDMSTGCVTNKSIQVAGAGPLFLAVKDVLTAKCISCHHTGQGGIAPNFSVDCTIVEKKLNIKNRAIDGNFQNKYMPPSNVKTITAAQETAILNWLSAGGRYTD